MSLGAATLRFGFPESHKVRTIANYLVYPRCSMVLVYLPTFGQFSGQMLVNIPAPWSIWVCAAWRMATCWVFWGNSIKLDVKTMGLIMKNKPRFRMHPRSQLVDDQGLPRPSRMIQAVGCLISRRVKAGPYLVQGLKSTYHAVGFVIKYE